MLLFKIFKIEAPICCFLSNRKTWLDQKDILYKEISRKEVLKTIVVIFFICLIASLSLLMVTFHEDVCNIIDNAR